MKEVVMGSNLEPAGPDARLTGRAVLNYRRDKLGKVTDVIFDDLGTPQWAVVRTGLLSGEHFMPLGESYVDDNGRLVVPLGKEKVKRAPRARRDHTLTLSTRLGLRDYYGIAA
jgi:hypothetical protein